VVETNNANSLFADARSLYQEAIEQLAQGKLRNAAEKAWGATKRATDALVLARTGEMLAPGRTSQEPRTSGQTNRGLHVLARRDERVAPLMGLYAIRQTYLHGQCFYDGNCEPEDGMEALIRQTEQYLFLAETLAEG
jgi:hypothetical protein